MWEPVTEREMEMLQVIFSKLSAARGVLPCKVMVVRDPNRSVGAFRRVAMQYIEKGKWERWGIRLQPPEDIRESWSTLCEWLRPLIGNRAAIEVYPRDEDIVNTAPTRWFFVLPGDQPAEWDLRDHQPMNLSHASMDYEMHFGGRASSWRGPRQ